MTTEEQRLLSDAADEIVRLRKQIHEQNIRLEMFDKMMFLVQAKGPGIEYGIVQSPSEDIVSKLDNYIVDNTDQLIKAVQDAMLLRKRSR